MLRAIVVLITCTVPMSGQDRATWTDPDTETADVGQLPITVPQ